MPDLPPTSQILERALDRRDALIARRRAARRGAAALDAMVADLQASAPRYETDVTAAAAGGRGLGRVVEPAPPATVRMVSYPARARRPLPPTPAPIVMRPWRPLPPTPAPVLLVPAPAPAAPRRVRGPGGRFDRAWVENPTYAPEYSSDRVAYVPRPAPPAPRPAATRKTRKVTTREPRAPRRKPGQVVRDRSGRYVKGNSKRARARYVRPPAYQGPRKHVALRTVYAKPAPSHKLHVYTTTRGKPKAGPVRRVAYRGKSVAHPRDSYVAKRKRGVTKWFSLF